MINKYTIVVFICLFAPSQASEIDCYVIAAEHVARKVFDKNSVVTRITASSETTSQVFFKVSNDNQVKFLKFSDVAFAENEKLKAVKKYVVNSKFYNELSSIFVLSEHFGRYNHSKYDKGHSDWNISKFIEGIEFASILNDFISNPSASQIMMFKILGAAIGRMHVLGNFRVVDGNFISDLVHKDLHPYNILVQGQRMRLIDNSNLFLSIDVIDDLAQALLQSTPFPMMLYCHALETPEMINENRHELNCLRTYSQATKEFMQGYLSETKIHPDMFFRFRMQLLLKILKTRSEVYIKNQEKSSKLYDYIIQLPVSKIISAIDEII